MPINPFESTNTPDDREPMPHMGADFDDAIKNPEQAEEIKAANSLPNGDYRTYPGEFTATSFCETREDPDGKFTGAAGSRRLGVLNVRLMARIKGEEYKGFGTIKISPDVRPKRVYVNGEFVEFHKTAHDAATRMYQQAQDMYKRINGRYSSSISSLLECLKEIPLKVSCMVGDDGKLIAYKIASVRALKSRD